MAGRLLDLNLDAPDPNGVAKTAAIVTGASSGLGRATAHLVAQAGRPVAVWGRNEVRTMRVAEECRHLGVEAIGVSFDISDRMAVVGAVAKSEKSLGLIGGLAMCHGIAPLGDFKNFNFESLELCLQTNLTSLAYTMDAALPSLLRVGRGAAIVAALSTAALRSTPLMPEYTAAKHGALGLIRAAARSLGPEGIRVNAVCPGAMDTPMLEAGLTTSGDDRELIYNSIIASIPLGYISDPIEVAHVLRFLISPESSYINGADIAVDGGMVV